MGILSKLYDHDLATRVAQEGSDEPEQPDFDREAPIVAPSASVIDAMAQIPVEPVVAREEAAERLQGDAPLPASELPGVRADALGESAGLDDADLDAAMVPEVEPLAVLVSGSQSHEAEVLIQLLTAGEWASSDSEDMDERARANAQQYTARRLVTMGIDKGNEEEMKRVWAAFAPPGAPAFDDIHRRRRGTAPEVEYGMRVVNGRVIEPDVVIDPPHYSMARTAKTTFGPTPTVDFPERPVRTPAPERDASPAAAPVQPAVAPGGGGGGFGVSDFLKAPFRFVGAAGSMVLAGLSKSGAAAQSAYVRHRINGHEVLGDQLRHHAWQVVEHARHLRVHGMADVIDAIENTGAPASEVFAGMGPGGKYQAIGQRFDAAMADPLAAARYAKLHEHMAAFERGAQRYAKAGVALNTDHDGPIREGAEAMMDAVAGLPTKDGSGFKHLQEKLHEMTEKIVEMIQRIFSRFAPT